MKTSVQSALASIIAAVPTATVTVTAAGGVSFTAIRDTVLRESGLTDMGQTGDNTSTIYANSDSAASVTKGETVSVDGDLCRVTDTDLDPVGAILTINYVVEKPVTGIDGL